MSRAIMPPNSSPLSQEEWALRDTGPGKLLFTMYREQLCFLLLQDGRITAASFLPGESGRVGAVYIGKVKKVRTNINACFVEIADREICFLSLYKAKTPCLLNRSFDGRILEGDELLVQIEQEAQKTKQAAVTAHISIHNAYFVLALGNTRLHYSTKLSSERKEAISSLLTENALLQDGCLVQDIHVLAPSLEYQDQPLPPIGVVARTKLEHLTEKRIQDNILEQFFCLAEEFCSLLCLARYRSCFSLVRKAPENREAAMTSIVSSLDIDTRCQEIITDQPEQYTWLLEYCQEHMPGTQVRLYQDSRLSLKTLYALDTRLDAALSSHVWLKSGAYLVIEPTEAMTVIDVNSGKCEVKADAEEAYFRINMEAATEVALQLRLRNLSGIIVVDFINMTGDNHINKMMSHLRTLVKRDPVITKVVDLTPLGLVEITRKKVNKPLHEQINRRRG